jgi:TonB family protein
MTALFFNNFLAWTAQIAILIAIGAIAAITLAPGRARLLFWQVLLAVALLLPAIEPWSTPPADTGGSISFPTSTWAVVVAPHTSRFTWRREDVLWLIAAGAALRALWIAVGLARLRRHRLAARRLSEPPVPFENLGIRWYVSDTVSGPVTFGWLRPSIVLPSRVCALPADLREAIACHELVHVRRRDWLYVLGEEAIRGLFWFHPAVWFALSQIQLAREQAVDSEVVRLMTNRERYLDALVAVAAHKLYPDVVPAPLFLKKRQLAVRVAAILKETRMSKARLVASFATVCSATLFAAGLAVWLFPLQSAAQVVSDNGVVRDGPGVTVDPGGKLMHRSPVFYSGSVSGTVMIDATLDSKGAVTDARVLSGPQELRAAALQSVLSWHYSADGGAPPSAQISITFAPPSMPESPQRAAAATAVKGSVPTISGRLTSIQFEGVSPELQQKVLQSLPVQVNDTVSRTQVEAMRSAVREIDEHFTVSALWRNAPDGSPELTLTFLLMSDGTRGMLVRGAVASGVSGGVVGGVSSGILGGVAGGVAGGVSTGVTPQPDPPQRIRVGGNVQSANLLIKVQPAYPPLAKQSRIQGVVSLATVISKDGTIQNLQVISGHPMLVKAALEAVKQWTYKPTLLNGQPVEVITQIDVNFTLSEQ